MAQNHLRLLQELATTLLDDDNQCKLIHHQGEIVYASQQTVAMLGCSKEEILQSKMSDWFPDDCFCLSPGAQANQVRFRLAKVNSSEFCAKNKGFRLDDETYILTQVTVHQPDTENLPDFQRLMTNSLHGFGLFKVISDTQGEPIDFICLQVNNGFTRHTGLTAKKLVNQSLVAALPSIRFTHPNLLDLYAEVAKTKIAQSREVYFIQEDQHYQINAYTDHLGYIAIILENISGRKHLEQDLRQAKEKAEAAVLAKQVFLGNISHELRTPLNGMLGASSLLAASKLDEDQTVYLGIMDRCSEKLLHLVEQLLDFHHIYQNRLALKTVPFSFHNLIVQCINQAQAEAKPKKLQVRLDFDPALNLTLETDSLRLRQVLQGLLSNAVKFTTAGSIQVRAHLLRQNQAEVVVLIEIQDTGIGIKEENQARIFANFTQLDNRLQRKYEGVGLGLSLCKRLVEMLGGKIWLRSKIDQGTLVSFTFKAENLGEDTRSPEIKKPDYQLHHTAEVDLVNPLKILVATANLINCNLLKGIFESLGHVPVLTTKKGEAAKLLESHRFDLVFLDFFDPVIEGEQLFQSFIAGAKQASPFTVALVSSKIARGPERAQELGADSTIIKPFLPSKIEGCLQDYRKKS